MTVTGRLQVACTKKLLLTLRKLVKPPCTELEGIALGLDGWFSYDHPTLRPHGLVAARLLCPSVSHFRVLGGLPFTSQGDWKRGSNYSQNKDQVVANQLGGRGKELKVLSSRP